MARSLNSALQDAGGDASPIGGVGSLEKNKESGLLKESADIYNEMLAPFAMKPDSHRIGRDLSLLSADAQRSLARRRRDAALGRRRARVA